MNRLITIPFSHYCEKARWALDLSAIPYQEEGHLPLLSRKATRPYSTRLVPILVTPSQVYKDSTDILGFVDTVHKLYPTDTTARRDCLTLEDELDERFGPQTRRLAYFHLLDAREAFDAIIAMAPVPTWQRRMIKVLRPVTIAVMKKGLGIDRPRAERSEKRVRAFFDQMSARLETSPYLCGDTFTAADLTFASLASPLLLPSEHPIGWPPRSTLTPAYLELSESLRATRAGAHALRCYSAHRRPPT